MLYYKGITGSVQSLFRINLEIPRGEIVGLFGENGAGKTTLEKCILGLVSYQGEILLDGKAVTREDRDRFAFATCEHSFFPNLTEHSITDGTRKANSHQFQRKSTTMYSERMLQYLKSSRTEIHSRLSGLWRQHRFLIQYTSSSLRLV